MQFPSDVSGWVGLVGGLIVVLGGFWKVVKPLSRLADDVKQIKHEVFPNSGGSLRDAVDYMRVDVNDLKTAHQQHIQYHLERV